MSLVSRGRECARTAAGEGLRRRRWGAILTALLFALGLVAPLHRARSRAAARAVRLEGLHSPVDRRLDLNEADGAALRALPGIGPGQAARILARRRLLGSFREVDDLSRLPGIGNNRLDRLRDLIRVERR